MSTERDSGGEASIGGLQVRTELTVDEGDKLAEHGCVGRVTDTRTETDSGSTEFWEVDEIEAAYVEFEDGAERWYDAMEIELGLADESMEVVA